MTVRWCWLGLLLPVAGLLGGCASNGCKSIAVHTSLVGESAPTTGRVSGDSFERRSRVELTYDSPQTKPASPKAESQEKGRVQIGGDLEIVYTAYDFGRLGGTR